MASTREPGLDCPVSGLEASTLALGFEAVFRPVAAGVDRGTRQVRRLKLVLSIARAKEHMHRGFLNSGGKDSTSHHRGWERCIALNGRKSARHTIVWQGLGGVWDSERPSSGESSPTAGGEGRLHVSISRTFQAILRASEEQEDVAAWDENFQGRGGKQGWRESGGIAKGGTASGLVAKPEMLKVKDNGCLALAIVAEVQAIVVDGGSGQKVLRDA
ncbi:hypothetical protein LXA43DRAFT_1061073 [Ganoderma leucocontextum]|nr:hypothetical protein LXA43DRAFT_1061073 [Ganoderma leucocontextum]